MFEGKVIFRGVLTPDWEYEVVERSRAWRKKHLYAVVYVYTRYQLYVQTIITMQKLKLALRL